MLPSLARCARSDMTPTTENRFDRPLGAFGLPECAIPSAYCFVPRHPQNRMQSLRQKVPAIKRIALQAAPEGQETSPAHQSRGRFL